MVKKIVIPIVAALVAVVVAVGAAVGIHYKQNGMWYNAYIEFNGSAKEEIQIINTKEELVYHLYERYEDDYDDSFFVFKSLVAIKIFQYESQPSYSVKDVYVEDKVLKVDLNAEYGGGSLQAHCRYLIIIEVNKFDIRNITDVQYIVHKNK
ncbi:MAG: hypothetical protein IKC35_04935 [Clostridia bacterium]|nr:hypothetical protein [Clostridia bacterium]